MDPPSSYAATRAGVATLGGAAPVAESWGAGKKGTCAASVLGSRAMDDTETQTRNRSRAQTAFGWIAGGSLGVLVSYGLFLLVGEAYPKEPAIVVLFALGAYGGMRLSDHLGPRGFKPLGIAAGILASLFIVLALLLLAESMH